MQLSDKAQASLNKVVVAFQSGDLSPVVEIIKIRRHRDDKLPASRWSLGNQLMAFIQSGGELDCRTFNQWKEVDRSVVKGGSAVFILAPLTMTIDDAAQPSGKRTFVKGFKSLPVFPLHQTDGSPLPSFDYAPNELPPLYDVAQRLGVTVSYGPIDDNARGWYSPDRKHIHLGVQSPKTFFHELAHAAHDKLDGVKGGQDVEQETIAEFTAAVLGDLYGFNWTGNAWNYIKGYADDPLTAIYKAMSIIERVLALILEPDLIVANP